jgi:hypothetical protein
MVSFQEKMLIRVSIIVLLANFVIFIRFYWFNLSSSILLAVTIAEILAIAITFAYVGRKYKLKW